MCHRLEAFIELAIGDHASTTMTEVADSMHGACIDRIILTKAWKLLKLYWRQGQPSMQKRFCALTSSNLGNLAALSSL
jgi:hypothetical protein